MPDIRLSESSYADLRAGCNVTVTAEDGTEHTLYAANFPPADFHALDAGDAVEGYVGGVYCTVRVRPTESQERLAEFARGYCGATDDTEADLKDILTDVLHLAKMAKLDPDDLVQRALGAYHAEADGNQVVT